MREIVWIDSLESILVFVGWLVHIQRRIIRY